MRINVIILCFLANVMAPAHSQSVLAQNEDAFVISRVGSDVVSVLLAGFTLGFSRFIEPSETSKQKMKWAKIMEVAKTSGCKALATSWAQHDDPEIAIRGTADSRGRSTFVRSNGAHLHLSSWGRLSTSSNTMFICARDDSVLHQDFKSLEKLERDLRLEGMLD
jgi:hypothetical protein